MKRGSVVLGDHGDETGGKTQRGGEGVCWKDTCSGK